MTTWIGVSSLSLGTDPATGTSAAKVAQRVSAVGGSDDRGGPIRGSLRRETLTSGEEGAFRFIERASTAVKTAARAGFSVAWATDDRAERTGACGGTRGRGQATVIAAEQAGALAASRPRAEPRDRRDHLMSHGE